VVPAPRPAGSTARENSAVNAMARAFVRNFVLLDIGLPKLAAIASPTKFGSEAMLQTPCLNALHAESREIVATFAALCIISYTCLLVCIRTPADF